MNLVYFLFFSITAGAGQNSDIQIQFNSVPQISKDSSEDYEIPLTESLKPSSSVLPESGARNSAFEQAGLLQILESWNEADRDLLYLRAQNRKSIELIQYYPKIEKEKLLKLQNFIHDTKRAPSQTN